MNESTIVYRSERPIAGLSSSEAQRRLLRDGPNELPSSRPRNFAQIALHVLAEPMFLLLLAAAAIYVALGDILEALVLTASIFVIVSIAVLQERRTEHALTRLRDLSSPRALVIRDGKEQRIPGPEVVVGDFVMLAEGDRVPADGILHSATALSVDESILTGESLPVDKEPGAANTAQVFSGALVVRGYGVAEITAIGVRTGIGKIGRALSILQPEVTSLFREVRRMVRWLAIAGLLLCMAITIFYALLRGGWTEGALAGITVAMGILPEEFPVVLTVFLAMGAWRISKQGVLTRRMPAIESIGAASLLAVDKTGTLTENRMRVAILETANACFDFRQASAALDDAALALLTTALAASEHDAFDPMEQAIHTAAQELIGARTPNLARRQLIREYDLTPELPAVTHVWQSDAEVFEVAVKGAPETVLELCRAPMAQRQQWLERVAAHAAAGLRVLAVASGEHRSSMPDTPHGFELRILGLVCLADPLRATVPAALAECAQAGIRVVMITGDHPGTALTIAKQAGFDVSDGVLTGAELAIMADDELRERARKVNVYARTKPEDKLRLVQAFKANGEIVAMTGDGVNDAPALKAAHIGVAMGSRGTDVAREAASLVLVNDDFASLVGAVRQGRRIYANIRHATSYLLAVHIPIAGMGLLPVLFGWPLLLFPVHVLFLEFIIDPACSFVFEADAEAAGAMSRPPRASGARLFSRRIVRNSVIMGLTALLFSGGLYGAALKLFPEAQARALSFVSMVILNLLLIFANRTRDASLGASLARPNAMFWWIIGASLLALGTVIYAPPVAALFQFSAPPPLAILAVLSSAALLISILITALLRAKTDIDE